MSDICRVTVTARGPAGSGKTLFLDHLKDLIEGNDQLEIIVVDENVSKKIRARAEAILVEQARDTGRLPVVVELEEEQA